MPSPKYKYRILYVGRDYVLSGFLQDALKHLDCFVVRCPGGRESRLFIGSDIKYSLLLFDEQLPDMTGAELKRFTLSLPHREKTPVLVVKKSDDWERLASQMKRRLGGRGEP